MKIYEISYLGFNDVLTAELIRAESLPLAVVLFATNYQFEIVEVKLRD